MNQLKKYSSLLFLLTVLLTTIFINLSCEDNPVTPNEPPPGRRDYEWSIDTIDAPNTSYYRMWASAPDDIWLVGQGTWEHSIAHFDGDKWSTYGVPRMNVAKSIYGFSKNNVYIGTAGGGIWNYDGVSWQQVAELTKDGHNNIVFDNMWGETQNDLYAFGTYSDSISVPNNSVIAHYTDNKWTMLNTDGLIGIVERYYKNKSGNKFYLRTNRIGGGQHPDSNFIYEHNQETYFKIYGSIWTKGEQADISLINNEVYFVLGNRIATRSNNQFNTIVNVDNPNFYQRIWGRSANDLFLLMTDGLVHYNGGNMEYLFNFNITPRTQIYGAALFTSEVFFLVYEAKTGKNLIYYGKLEEK